jgi:hypothetical protein
MDIPPLMRDSIRCISSKQHFPCHSAGDPSLTLGPRCPAVKLRCLSPRSAAILWRLPTSSNSPWGKGHGSTSVQHGGAVSFRTVRAQRRARLYRNDTIRRESHARRSETQDRLGPPKGTQRAKMNRNQERSRAGQVGNIRIVNLFNRPSPSSLTPFGGG